MSLLEAIILGLVQGLTEFIPVSSSGHLVLTSKILNVDSFTFDVLLNIGTLSALLIYFRLRILNILKKIIYDSDIKYVIKIIAATIPTVLIGYFLSDQIEELNKSITVIIVTLTIIGIAMIYFDKKQADVKLTTDVQKINWRQTLTIGAAQVIALIPGVSRSGITIMAGLRSRLDANTAAEFSFMLAIPTITGAILKTLLDSSSTAFIKDNLSMIIIGNLVSFCAGLLAVDRLIKIINKYGLKIFGYYRIGLAIVLCFLLIAGII